MRLRERLKSLPNEKRPGRACDRVIKFHPKRYTVRYLNKDLNLTALTRAGGFSLGSCHTRIEAKFVSKQSSEKSGSACCRRLSYPMLVVGARGRNVMAYRAPRRALLGGAVSVDEFGSYHKSYRVGACALLFLLSQHIQTTMHSAVPQPKR
jgi:hypothetical protein